MISKLKTIWEKNGFEIILGLCIAFLLIIGLYYKFTGKKGTYSNDKYFYMHRKTPFSKLQSFDQSNNKKRGPPKVSKGELQCRNTLERLFNKPFKNQRPNWLRNPVTGGNFNLELDCYNEELKLAVEYNGIQHYKFTPYFHRTQAHFMNQKYRDDMKRRMCKEHGVVLIEVPYNIKLEHISMFIKKECIKAGYRI